MTIRKACYGRSRVAKDFEMADEAKKPAAERSNMGLSP
jgi:hypothetical protein